MTLEVAKSLEGLEPGVVFKTSEYNIAQRLIRKAPLPSRLQTNNRSSP